MNQHIQEIAIKCASNMFWNGGVPSDYTFNPDDLAEFVRILVNHCTDIVYMEVPGLVGMMASEKLVLHFGGTR